MTRCSTGRATQKYRGNGTDLSDILETPGDIIYADAAVSAENLVISGTTGDVLKVSASGIPEWGTSTSQWITSGDDISYSLGHVGIGTTSPDANLHVTGNAFVSTDLGLGGTLTMGNVLVEALHELSAITATGNVTPHTVEFQNATTGFVTTANIEVGKDLTVTGNVAVDTDTLYVDAVNDRVGIGTVTPLQTLEVNGSVGINHNGVGGYTFHTSTGALRAGIHSTGGNHLQFKAGSNNERMRLLAGGQLGIGTSTPSKPLTVDGNVHIPSGSEANSGSFPQNSVTRSIYFGGISQSGSMYQSKTAIVSAPWTQYGGTQSWGRHGLHFCVDSVADNGNVELGQTKMCINYLGNVGIGSWSTPNPLPQTLASVHGGRVLEGRDASGFEFIAASSDTTNANGQFNGAFLIKNMDTDGSEPHYVGMAGRGNSTNGSMDLLFYSGRDNYENNTPQMVIDPSGNVGIGTSAPGYTLDVTGDINFTGNLTQNGSAYGGGGSGSSPWTYTAGTASGTQQLVFDDQAPSTTFTGTLSGNVNNTAIRDTTNGYIRLTQAGTTRMGSAYWQTTLTNNWEATFEIYILPITYGGADDMRFVFYATNPITTNASATGTNGHGGAYMRWEYYNTDFVELYDHTATRVSQQSASLQMSGWMPVTVTFNNGVLTSTIRNSSGTTLNTTTHDFGTTYAALYNTPTYVAITGQSGGVQAEDRVRNITINALNVQTGDTVTRVNANVGIGTSSPDEILHLSSNDTNGAFLKVVGDTSNRAGIKLDEDAGDANIILEYDGNGSGAGNYFSIYSDVTGWVGKGGGFNYIPSNGRVGIGTNSPQGPLHVSSGTAGDCRLILQADTDNNDEGDNPRIEFWQDGAIQESAIGMTSNRLNLWNSVSSGGGIAFHTGTTDGYTNAIERMTITSAGNVGINQTSPNYTLDVTGDINFTGTLTQNGSAYGGGGSSSSPWVTSGNDISYTTGRVGVGTTSPDANLHVEGNVYMSSNLNVGPTVSATLAYQQQGKIQASDAQATDEFGYSVSISGDGNTAIIGAYQEDDTGFVYEAGAAYVFTLSGGTWTQQQKIQASDRQTGDRFGYSVSLSSDGNTAIIGAYREDTVDTDAGAAYIFTRSSGTWTQQQKIQASDIQAVDYFGYSVSLSSDGNTALIGAYREDTGASNAGAAYIFTRSSATWTQQQKIQASDIEKSDYFGHSVSLSGDGNTALVGAIGEDTVDTDAGAAYVFTLSGGTWTQQQKIQASDRQTGDRFGYSVSLSSDGNTAIIGAYREDTVDTDAGAAYIFTRSSGTWTQQQKIQASDIQAVDYFGYSVSLSSDGNTALIGAYREDTGASNAGAAYIFTRSSATWTQQQKIQASDAQAYDEFGHSVSLSSDGNTAIIGAYREDTVDTDAGAAYIFTSTGTPGSETVLCVNTTLSRVGIGTATPNYTLDVAGDLTCSGTMRHRAFAFYARASGGQIVAGNGILSDSNSTITTEFDYTPAGTASSNGFRSSGGASNNQGTYFAPLDGIYHVSCKVRLNDSSTAQQEIQWYIKRTNGNEDQWESFEMWISPADGGGRRATMSSTIVKLAKDEGIFPRADNPTTSLSSATFGGHFLGTY